MTRQSYSLASLSSLSSNPIQLSGLGGFAFSSSHINFSISLFTAGRNTSRSKRITGTPKTTATIISGQMMTSPKNRFAKKRGMSIAAGKRTNNTTNG
jgi:hypothetical protein